MSRHITFTAVFKNGKRATYGAYNKTNAEYYKSKLDNHKVYEALHNLINHCEGKVVLRIEITINVSTGHWNINHYIPELRIVKPVNYFKHHKVQKAIVYTRIANDIYKPNTN